MNKDQKNEIEKELWIRQMKRKLGVKLKPKTFGDPLPPVFARADYEKRAKTKYKGMEDIQVRIG